MSEIKGKVVVSQVQYDEPDNDYDIDTALKEELSAQGLDYKYIDFKQAKLNGGRSRGGWIVYKRTSADPRIGGIKALADPDGLVRNGSMVLAVKTKQNADRQRSRVRDQARSLSQYQNISADELGKDVRKLGGNSRVIKGYDNNS